MNEIEFKAHDHLSSRPDWVPVPRDKAIKDLRRTNSEIDRLLNEGATLFTTNGAYRLRRPVFVEAAVYASKLKGIVEQFEAIMRRADFEGPLADDFRRSAERAIEVADRIGGLIAETEKGGGE